MPYFFDSYAIIEMIKGNENYKRFSDEVMITTSANLSEVKYFALRTGLNEEYDQATRKIMPDLLQTTLQDWQNAAQMKFNYKVKRYSLIDCLGFELAKKHGLIFLTGDKEFIGMPNVEHVV